MPQKKVWRKGSEYQRADGIAVKTNPHMTTVPEKASVPQSESSRAATRSHIDQIASANSGTVPCGKESPTEAVEEAVSKMFDTGSHLTHQKWRLAPDESYWMQNKDALREFVINATGNPERWSDIDRCARDILHAKEDLEVLRDNYNFPTAVVAACEDKFELMTQEGGYLWSCVDEYQYAIKQVASDILGDSPDRLVSSGLLAYSEEDGTFSAGDVDYAEHFKANPATAAQQ